MESPKLYALLVGINDYKEPIARLRGCLNDVGEVANYLTNASGFKDPAILTLTNERATRPALIDGFRTHLARAEAADTVLLYYSGHGTQETADTSVWKEETDGALETLVLYNETQNYSDFLFTDKELRYLIHELYQKTGAHIVTIFDCCHSGANTRNGSLIRASYADSAKRQVTKDGGLFPQREWTAFLFADRISESDAKGSTTTGDILPQGVHVQMAASESNQSAVEVSGAGVFTKSLLKILRSSGGQVTYNALRSRVRQSLRGPFEQTPRIYIPLDAEKWLYRGFLNREVTGDRAFFEATWNSTLGWQLNAGAIHGVEVDSEITLRGFSGEVHSAKVRPNGVFVDYTLLEASLPDFATFYKAEVSGLLTRKLILELENHDATPEEVLLLQSELEKQAGGSFVFGGEKGASENEKDSGVAETADYTLHLNNGDAYLTIPGDTYRPLVQPIDYLNSNDSEAMATPESKSEAALKIATVLRQISRWHFIKSLKNPSPPAQLKGAPLKVEVTRIKLDGTTEKVVGSDSSFILNYEKFDGTWQGSIQIKITNTTPKDLYVCAVYLSKEFQSFVKFIPTRVQLLESGNSIFLGPNGRDRINLRLGDVEQEYNWAIVQEAIQFIVSTEEFDAEGLTMEELPGPLTLAHKVRSLAKSLVTRAALHIGDEALLFRGWTTQLLNLTFKNPVYNQVPRSTIEGLLDWEETAFFAAGLYTIIEMDDSGYPTKFSINPSLVLPEDEKGILGQAKMWAGNVLETAIRDFKYKKLKKDPSRIRIVAEGDSWFQYPLILKDILDHLYKRYAIKNFSEAGDTLENYVKEGNRKKYIDAIENEKAEYFLVSGGGNDVIGEEFPAFLKKKVEVDPSEVSPNKYLKLDAFTKQLDKMEKYYEEMFSELIEKFPNLKILVHSYDYVIPVGTLDKVVKPSWSGKHMVEKDVAIDPLSERKAVIVLILNLFAERLEKLERKFKPNVTFVKTFGSVEDHEWKDEIHPINEGYQKVADKFIKIISGPSI